MPATTAQKLKIKEGYTLRTFHAPKNFQKVLGDLPPDVKIDDNAKTYNQIHWFVSDKAQLEKELPDVLALLKENVTCWIYYPKGTSKMQTDLTRDKGWDGLKMHKELQWISLVSFDETWSAFAMRQKTGATEKKKTAPTERPITQYIDAEKKIVYLPDDLASKLKNAPEEKAFFEKLSYSHKKEYVEWIVSAKREETRNNRVKATIERLAKGWKNPANQ